MNNYGKRVRELAEEMAKAHYKILNANHPECKWEDESELSKEGSIFDEWHRARIAIKHMAETYKKCRMQFCEYDDHVPGWAIEQALLSEMEERGLIPPTEAGKEAEGDG